MINNNIQFFAVHLCDVDQPLDSIKLVDDAVKDKNILLLRYFYQNDLGVDLKAKRIKQVLTTSHHRCPVFVDESIARKFDNINVLQHTVLVCNTFSEEIFPDWFGNTNALFISINTDVRNLLIFNYSDLSFNNNRDNILDSWRNTFAHEQLKYPTPYISRSSICECNGIVSELIKKINQFDAIYPEADSISFNCNNYFDSKIFDSIESSDIRLSLSEARNILKKPIKIPKL